MIRTTIVPTGDIRLKYYFYQVGNRAYYGKYTSLQEVIIKFLKTNYTNVD